MYNYSTYKTIFPWNQIFSASSFHAIKSFMPHVSYNQIKKRGRKSHEHHTRKSYDNDTQNSCDDTQNSYDHTTQHFYSWF